MGHDALVSREVFGVDHRLHCAGLDEALMQLLPWGRTLPTGLDCNQAWSAAPQILHHNMRIRFSRKLVVTAHCRVLLQRLP